MERFGETLTPTFDLWSLPEWALLRGETLCARRITQAAVAGEFSAVAIVVPATADLIAVVEEVTAATTAAGVFELDVATEAQIVATLALNAQALSRDRRKATFQGRTLLYAGSDAASFIGSALERAASTAANVPARFVTGLPVVLSPGQGLVIIGQTVNLTNVVSFKWRERAMVAGEQL